MIICENGKLKVRELNEQDVDVLVKWLSDPRVLEYYEGRDRSFDEQMVKDKFYTPNISKTRCIIEYYGEKIGYVQFYPLDEDDLEEYGYEVSDEVFYGTDQFIGEVQYWNKGIGTNLMQEIVKYLIIEKNAKKIVLDPHCNNKRAIACYEKCGFEKIRKLTAHEIHEGTLEDCWIMELDNTKSNQS